jgi:hypothetical protein
MTNTHFLTSTMGGLKHTVTFTAVGKTCTISSEYSRTVEAEQREFVRSTPKTNWSLVAGRRFYKKYLAQGYTA